MDNPNMNDVARNRQEWWKAKQAEHQARLEKMDAEERIKYNDMFDDFSAEVSAMSDWTEASWNEFVAKVDQKWQEFTDDTEHDDK